MAESGAFSPQANGTELVPALVERATLVNTLRDPEIAEVLV